MRGKVGASRAGSCLTALVAVTIWWAHSASAQDKGFMTRSLYNIEGAPTAGFAWFPTSPHVGERVTLVSTSTDLVSPIAGFGWDLTEVGGFTDDPPAITTVFPTPADHLVRLRVTARDGLSSIASETIHMSRAAPTVMYPFPIIRIVTVDFVNGARVRLLAVKAPTLARITLACHGRGCRVRSAHRAVASRRPRWITFPRVARFLRPGASITVRVSKGALIGAYTRFSIRRRRLPVRVDACLDPPGLKPIACPP